MPACHVAPPWQKWFLTFFSQLFDVSEDDTLTHTHMDPLTKYRLTLTNPNIQCDISDFLARMSSDGKAHGKLAPSSSVSKERDTTVCFLFAFIYLYLFTLHVFYFNIPELKWTELDWPWGRRADRRRNRTCVHLSSFSLGSTCLSTLYSCINVHVYHLLFDQYHRDHMYTVSVCPFGFVWNCCHVL